MTKLITKKIVAKKADLRRDPLSGTAAALAGASAAEAVNPTEEETFWRLSYIGEPYYLAGRPYEYYAPGFRAGWEGRVRHSGRTFIEAEADLMRGYLSIRDEFDPSWLDMRPAAQAAWNRVDLGRF